MFDSKSPSPLKNDNLLLPVSVMAFTLMLFFSYVGFQSVQQRRALDVVQVNQQKAFEDSQRVQEQVRALLQGTVQLSDQGNKNAKVITDRLKELGILQAPAEAQAEGTAPSPAPVPAATEKTERGPVKP